MPEPGVSSRETVLDQDPFQQKGPCWACEAWNSAREGVASASHQRQRHVWPVLWLVLGRPLECTKMCN